MAPPRRTDLPSTVMSDFEFTELLPIGPDATAYRKLDLDGVTTVEGAGHTFLQVEPRVLTAEQTAAVVTTSPPRRVSKTSPPA